MARYTFPKEGMNVAIRRELYILWLLFYNVDLLFPRDGLDGIPGSLMGPTTGSRTFRIPINADERKIQSRLGEMIFDKRDQLFERLRNLTLTYAEVREKVDQARIAVDMAVSRVDISYDEFHRYMENAVASRRPERLRSSPPGPEYSDDSILIRIGATAGDVYNIVADTAARLGEVAQEIDTLTASRSAPERRVFYVQAEFGRMFPTVDGTPTGAIIANPEDVIDAVIHAGHNIFFGDVHGDDNIPAAIQRHLANIAAVAGDRPRVFSVEFVNQRDQRRLDEFAAAVRAVHADPTLDAETRNRRLEQAGQRLLHHIAPRGWSNMSSRRPRLIAETLEAAVRHGFNLHAHDVSDSGSTRLEVSNAAWADSLRALPPGTLVVAWGGRDHSHAFYGFEARLDQHYVTIDMRPSSSPGAGSLPGHIYFNADPVDSDFELDPRPASDNVSMRR